MPGPEAAHLERVCGSVGPLALNLQRDSRGKALEAQDGQLISGIDLVVVLSRGEGPLCSGKSNTVDTPTGEFHSISFPVP